ncbi:MAG TPA: transcriptional repressor NrdR [Candidatus Coatesbacteria bacterium]|nr:transcriptional repressor NrdR [Candidatus Coatesbacteria bacterium]
MRCPYCGQDSDRVTDTRPSRGGELVRRRRECLECGRHFTTYEKVEEPELKVKKRDGRRERFDRAKIMAGLEKACEKRPVSHDQLEAVVARVETELRNRLGDEVESSEIGELLMRELAELDDVAYVRFASVYHQFADTAQFTEALRRLREERRRRARRKKPEEGETLF